ncbi:PREDICTED: uncharacterized protein LOC109590762 [Amphimedon queenslandica]|uniref:IRS-type PTB domain-containing protein n=1 Tax=Amphimedon queenslandica TaxID=400682 RepID=A0AAN0JYK3_AMPQE|nr:PREDICTED: uncharacterized protein LOC109590762 [Amphimedon queenslandica]|eukprot:XP_019862195.1 PREDICTED: uncharacterized protein LOC109590762 [Amphimedon queenslandica]
MSFDSSGSGEKLFDYLRIKFRIEAGCKVSCNIPSNTWKEYKKQWVVLNTSISPSQCYITYCPQEEYWISNQKKLSKLVLDNFHLEKPSGRSAKNILGICYEHYTLFIEFESTSKLQLWSEKLDIIRTKTLVELVRSPEHPEREREYIIDLQQDRLLFFPHQLGHEVEDIVEFEWKLDCIRRAKYHKHVGKVEVEVGRAAVTGEGHFYFIGPQIVHFFQILKERIEVLSHSSNNAFSPSSTRKKPDNSYSTRRKPSDHSFSGSVDYTPMSTSSPEDPDGHQGDSPSSTGESSGDPYPFRAPLPPPPLSPPVSASHKLPAIPPVATPVLSPAPSIPEFSEAGHYPLSKSVSMTSDYQSLQHSTRQRPSEYESVSLTAKPSFRINSLQ